jgi:hypothetical protein
MKLLHVQPLHLRNEAQPDWNVIGYDNDARTGVYREAV